jgi:hypothetical protein
MWRDTSGHAQTQYAYEYWPFSLLYTYNSEGNIGRTIKIPAFAIDKGWVEGAMEATQSINASGETHKLTTGQ